MYLLFIQMSYGHHFLKFFGKFVIKNGPEKAFFLRSNFVGFKIFFLTVFLIVLFKEDTMYILYFCCFFNTIDVRLLLDKIILIKNQHFGSKLIYFLLLKNFLRKNVFLPVNFFSSYYIKHPWICVFYLFDWI